MKFDQSIEEAAKIIFEADVLLITAGAGIGVDSGLPDFRGNEGFWKAYPPISKLGISFVEMANPNWFQRDPQLAWGFYGHRLNLYRRTQPHPGFQILLELANKKENDYFIFTSNVDGQFQIAGFDDKKIEECHGSIHHFQCIEPCSDEIWDASEINVEINEDNFRANEPLPKCINCDALARPNILMFGDWLWLHQRSNEQSSRFSQWIKNIIEKNISMAIIELGAGEAVPTVRFKSESIARYPNATLIRINPRDYYVPDGNVSLPLGSLEGISKINELIKKM
jgi:NAD-dependent SIR2 family protein deacetylase